jgi:GNAT superfamily N-acetyltransferase
MATWTLVTILDDIDRSEGAETVSFGLDGRAYEIDLAPRNKAKLEKALAPYVAAARKTTTGARGTSQRPYRGSGLGTNELQAIRAWAADQGIEVAARGRIAASVIDAYHAAR